MHRVLSTQGDACPTDLGYCNSERPSQIATRGCGWYESLRFPMQNQKSRTNSKLLTHGFCQLGHGCRCFFVLFLEGRRKDKHVGNTSQLRMNTMGLLQLCLSPFLSYTVCLFHSHMVKMCSQERRKMAAR